MVYEATHWVVNILLSWNKINICQRRNPVIHTQAWRPHRRRVFVIPTGIKGCYFNSVPFLFSSFHSANEKIADINGFPESRSQMVRVTMHVGKRNKPQTVKLQRGQKKHHKRSPYGMCSIFQGFVWKFNPVNPTVIFYMQISKLSTWSNLMMIKKTVVKIYCNICHLINSLYFLARKRHFSLILKTSSFRWLFAMKSSLILFMK